MPGRSSSWARLQLWTPSSIDRVGAVCDLGRMTVQLNPYLNFHTEAREAMEFYKSVFGGELVVSTFADFMTARRTWSCIRS